MQRGCPPISHRDSVKATPADSAAHGQQASLGGLLRQAASIRGCQEGSGPGLWGCGALRHVHTGPTGRGLGPKGPSPLPPPPPIAISTVLPRRLCVPGRHGRRSALAWALAHRAASGSGFRPQAGGISPKGTKGTGVGVGAHDPAALEEATEVTGPRPGCSVSRAGPWEGLTLVGPRDPTHEGRQLPRCPLGRGFWRLHQHLPPFLGPRPGAHLPHVPSALRQECQGLGAPPQLAALSPDCGGPAPTFPEGPNVSASCRLILV